jgi:hypothetical protein
LSRAPKSFSPFYIPPRPLTRGVRVAQCDDRLSSSCSRCTIVGHEALALGKLRKCAGYRRPWNVLMLPVTMPSVTSMILVMGVSSCKRAIAIPLEQPVVRC